MAAVSTVTNPRGIPQALFVNDVDEFMSGQASVEAVLDEFNQQYSKYKFLENNHLQRKGALQEKLPEMERTLEAVRFLKTKKASGESFDTKFELAETLFATATIPAADRVYLWLGANVMLEYELNDAEALLVKNVDTAQKSLKTIEEDLEFLREQIVTMEVNSTRVHNFDVKRRRLQQQQHQPSSSTAVATSTS